MIEYLVEVLPRGAVLVVTADHGQVDVGDRVIRPHPEVLSLVDFQSGEARFRWLHAIDGGAGELLDAAARHHGDVAWVMSRDQILDGGWFGPKVVDRARERLGDVALVARDDIAFDDPADTGPVRPRRSPRVDDIGRGAGAVARSPSIGCADARRDPARPSPSASLPTASAPNLPSDAGDGSGAEDIESPGKIIRIGSMVKQLLEEVRQTNLDEAARDQLRDIYENSLDELRSALSPELAGELDRLTLDFDDDTVPSEAQLRVAKAQLVGWLEGLFHGIQATLMAQQFAARQQLEGMRAQLPQGPGGRRNARPGGIPRTHRRPRLHLSRARAILRITLLWFPPDG